MMEREFQADSRAAVQSVLQGWTTSLHFQQQSVLMLALRGPDGDSKHTKFKHLLRAYRGTVLKAAKFGRALNWGERGDSFMSLDVFAEYDHWTNAVRDYLEDEADGAVLHHYTHFMHGAQIIGVCHPHSEFRSRWRWTYEQFVDRLHLTVEPDGAMLKRLGDWDRKYWSK